VIRLSELHRRPKSVRWLVNLSGIKLVCGMVLLFLAACHEVADPITVCNCDVIDPWFGTISEECDSTHGKALHASFGLDSTMPDSLKDYQLVFPYVALDSVQINFILIDSLIVCEGVVCREEGVIIQVEAVDSNFIRAKLTIHPLAGGSRTRGHLILKKGGRLPAQSCE